MKRILLIVATFTVAITALHAQVPPAAPVPIDPAVQAAVDSTVNPAVKAAVDDLVPHKYAGLVSLAFVAYLFFSRVMQGRKNKLSWLDAIAAAVNGTNVPTRFPILIACLCMLGLSSCSTMKKIGAALSTPQAKQVELALVDVGMHVALADGVITPGDVVTIGNGVAVVTSGSSTISKVMALSDLGLKAAVNKGLVKPGDAMLIKDSTTLITQALTPVSPITPPPAAITPTVQ